MTDFYSLFRPLLFALPAEAAHRAAVLALHAGLLPDQPSVVSSVLKTRVGDISFPHPIGLAAGFDKDGEAIASLFGQGFAAVECGTITPRPQAGNPKPRLFRLPEDEAVINRMGFNNGGAGRLTAELHRQQDALRKHRGEGRALGINIGKNKDSADAVFDYTELLRGFAHHADYITLNISSPNTPGLRDLQSGSALVELLDAVCNTREEIGSSIPLWLKVAPDLTDEQAVAVAETVSAYPIDALIVSNTTLARPNTLRSLNKNEQGGLSGKPLLELSTDRLALFYRVTGGKLPLVGVGGVASPEGAYAKIRAGASFVQLYSALVYQGFGLVTRIKRELPLLLERDGFASIADAVGVDALTR